MKKQTLKLPTIKKLASLIKSIKSDIHDDCRADECDDTPGICLTVGADETGWDYQTGDNSFSGGVYLYPYWGVASIYRRSNSRDIARDLLDQIQDAAAQ